MTEFPNSWIKIKLAEVLISLESGSRPKGGVKNISDGYPSLGAEHIGPEGKFNFTNIKFIPLSFGNSLERGKLQIGDILIVKDGATTGRVGYVGNDFPFTDAYVNEHVFKCTIHNNFGISKYFFWFLYSPLGKAEVLQNFRGAAQGGIIRSFAQNVTIPLPPLDEQKQIVQLLDATFAKAENAKSFLIRLPEIIKQLRAAILNNSASGRLTEKWRIRNNLPNWQTVKLSDVIIDKPRNGYSPKPVDYETSVKSLTLAATTKGKFDASFYKYIDHPIDLNSYLWLEDGDILIQRGNTIEYVGVSAIYHGDSHTYIYPDLMMKIRPNNKVLGDFLYFSLSSDLARTYFRENATGVSGSMPKINQKVLMNLNISLPSIEEQAEIIRRAKNLLALADDIEVKCKSALVQIESTTTMTLHKAFSGELTKKWRHKNSNLKPIDARPPIISKPQKITKKSKRERIVMRANKIIPVLEVLNGMNQAISTQELLASAGYPLDSSDELIEMFFLDIRKELIAGNILRERIGNEDYFEKAQR